MKTPSPIRFYDSNGNEIVVNYFGISTGEKNGYYTLRAYGDKTTYTRTEFGPVASVEPTSVYIRSLSTTKDKALVSARRFLASHFPAESVVFRGVIEFDLDEIQRISREQAEAARAAEAARVAATDYTKFQGGKYSGRPVAEVYAEDARYVEWFANNSWYPESDNARVAAVAKALVAPAEEARASASASLAARLSDRIGTDTLEYWVTGQAGGFLASIAIGLRSGNAPAGRGRDILLEILAKQAGRKGSKGYEAAFERLQAEF